MFWEPVPRGNMLLRLCGQTEMLCGPIESWPWSVTALHGIKIITEPAPPHWPHLPTALREVPFGQGQRVRDLENGGLLTVCG